MKCNITTIGGGTGTFHVLSGLGKNPDLNLAAIVSMADSGGSSGELRDEFGILPPGDIRRAIVALSGDTEIVRRLFEYRFKEGSGIAGHTVGNLLLTALSDIMGNFERGIEELSVMFDVRGKVIPVTLDDVSLGVTLENGEQIIGETHIDMPMRDVGIPIQEAFLLGGGRLNPRAREAIENSDYIIIGPGDLYTSIVPNLLCAGMGEALEAAHGKIVYVCNIMTQRGETEHFSDSDHVEVLHRHLGRPFIDTVLVNIEKVPREYMDTNRFDEYLVQVEHDFAGLCKQVPRVISSNFLRLENGGAFHDGDLIVDELMRIIQVRK